MVDLEGLFFEIPDFKLISNSKIGSGSFGDVFLCAKSDSEKKYAAKVLRIGDDFNSYQQKQFLSESLILYKLQHPFILKFEGINFKSIIDPKQFAPTIITEYLSHGSLKENLIKEQHPHSEKISMTKKLKLVLGICDAMRYLHKNGIIHRDLKPHNILIDENFYPRICDFGLSRYFPESLSNSMKLEMTGGIGTPVYMAPELIDIDEGSIGPSIDVYAFGIILYEIVTGKEPYSEIKELTPMKLSKYVLSGNRPEFTKCLTEMMKNLISRCLSANIDERPSFDEIFDDLSKSYSSYIGEAAEVDKKEIEKFIDSIEKDRKERESKEKKIKSDLIEKVDDDYFEQKIDGSDVFQKVAIFQDKTSISYKLYENREKAEIIPSPQVSGTLHIPVYISFGNVQYKVFNICDKAFSNSSLECLSFSSNSVVDSIGNSAFKNSKIRKLEIPKSLTKLGNLWCKGADMLSEIDVVQKNTYFSCVDGFLVYENKDEKQKHILFASQKFKGEFLIPEGTTKIGDYSFRSHKGISSLQSASSALTLIGTFSFSRCENLQFVSIQQDKPLILDRFCFADSKSLKTVEISCKEFEAKEKCFLNCTELTSFKIDKSTTIKLHPEAFNGCSNLQEISLNKSSEISVEKVHFGSSKDQLKSISFNEIDEVVIQPQAFEEFQSLETVSLKNIKELKIGEKSFYRSPNLKTIEMSSVDDLVLGDNFASQSQSLSTVTIETKSDVTIFLNTFKQCALKSVAVQASKLKLSSYCFEGCQALASVRMDCDEIDFGSDCFNNCHSLSSLSLKCKGDIPIKSDTFYGCRTLVEVRLQTDSSLEISDDFLSDSLNLQKVALAGKVVRLGSFCFKNCKALNCFAIINSGTVELGRENFVNCESINSISIESNEDSTVEFGVNCFSGAVNMSEFIVKSGEVTIGNDCFKSCSKLDRLLLLDSAKVTISEGQINDLESLQTIVISSMSDVKIGRGCFCQLDKLSMVTIKGENVAISNDCFKSEADKFDKSSSQVNADSKSDNQHLKIILKATSKLSLFDRSFDSSNVEQIGLNGHDVFIEDECFYNCSLLNQLLFGQVSNLTIGSSAFNMCVKLENVYFETTNSITLQTNCFFGSSVKTVSLINDQYITIECGAFKSLSSLTQIRIASRIIDLGNIAFEGCRSLTEIFLDATSDLKIGDFCFSGVTNIKELKMSGSTIEIYKASFSNCSSIKSLSFRQSDKVVFGEKSFENCHNIESLTVNAKSEFIAHSNSFSNLQKLKSVLISSGKVLVDSSGFAKCQSLESFNIENAEEVMFASYAFSECKNPATVKITAKNYFEASDYCFYKSKLKSLLIDAQNIKFANHCFDKCSLQQCNCPSAIKVMCSEIAFKGINLTDFIKCQPTTEIVIFKNESDENKSGWGWFNIFS